ncbi:MAG: hypothetical protein WC557_00125 [Ignavibacteriaceae bacterium]
MLKKLICIYIFCIATTINIWAFNQENILIENKEYINKYAKVFNISPRLLASIIYTEQKLNVMPGEGVLDYIFAKSGYNSSLGIAQVKINTAEWIEQQINNTQSPFYLGESISFLIKISNSRNELINKLSDPKTNILYAACYVAMILKIWGNELDFTSLNEIKVGITATLYTLGILDCNGKIRMPHPGAAMNVFGKSAQEFYLSFFMRKDFNN